MGVENDDFEAHVSATPSSDEEASHPGRLHTLTPYFIFSDPANGFLVNAIASALHAVHVSHITNLRLGGVINMSVLEAMPPSWLSNLTHLALELTNLNPTHPASPLSMAFIAKVPAFRALRALGLSLYIYPSAVPHDLSALETFLSQLLPSHQLDRIVTTVAACGPPLYLDAVRRHYDYCCTRADEVKVRWEDGKPELLGSEFPQLFADGSMQVGKLRSRKWISW
ncbi:hypothetical protein C8R43DRAFT_1127757 [Mycena crocata]|nr:hypothetical protein C8R43DRAFT_1127757 [Mycena crocata]